MTDAGWTSNKPTKEGWYWWRNLPTDNAPEVWAIVDHGDGLEVVGPFDETCLDEWVADMKGEWLGPISPTDRQQGRVEGLRAAARQLREGERLAQSREVANALQGYAYMLEQQAQGGQQ